ncbi:MAG: hypothetical protein HYZ29_19200 [Myxococcales bacterium]|nr:hypothetical protein [Myxococcales bacterium]
MKVESRIIAVALGLFGCGGLYDVESGEHCRQAGYSIAARIQACTQDDDRANQAYERFSDRYTCSGDPSSDASYGCAIDLNAVTCEEVAQWGDDLDRFIAETPSCHTVLGGWSGGGLPNAAGCTPLAAALAPKVATCGQSSTNLPELVSSVQKALETTGCVSGPTDDCMKELEALACSASTAPADPLSWAGLAPACDALRVKP